MRFQEELGVADDRQDFVERVRGGTSRLAIRADQAAQAQRLMDDLVLLLHAFFVIVQPFAVARCHTNPRTGVHVRTIANQNRFIQTNSRPAMDIYKVKARTHDDDEFPTLISLSAIHALVEELLWIASRQKQGRWQWDGFWLSNQEWTDLPLRILQTYIAGYHPLRSPRLPG